MFADFLAAKLVNTDLLVRVRFDKIADGPQFFEFILSLLLDANLFFAD